MAIRLECGDYGFECNFVVENHGTALIKQLQQHFEEEHGINYSDHAILQMIEHRGYSRDSIMKG